MPAIVTRGARQATKYVLWGSSDDDKRTAHKAERHRVRQILGQHFVDDYQAEEELDRSYKPRLTDADVL